MGNFVKLALRNLRREKLYAAINVVGLALGLACCTILGLYLHGELTYDRHHLQHASIYRVANEVTGAVRMPITPRPLGLMLKEEFPEIREAVRFGLLVPPDGSGIGLRHGDDVHYWTTAYYADEQVFDVFTHRILHGDPKTALRDPKSMAVSEHFARTYFGDADPLGEIVTGPDGSTHQVTLVFADLPGNTHLKYDVLYSSHAPEHEVPADIATRVNLMTARNGFSEYTYLLVSPGFQLADWDRIWGDFYQRHLADAWKTLRNNSYRAWLQPLASLHLSPENLVADQPTGNRMYLYGCALVATFILVIACINYMNLATARAARRARDVALRKILGASRVSLALRFLCESVLYALAALVAALLLVQLLVRFTSIDTLLGGHVRVDLLGEPAVLGLTFVAAALVGLLSGLYPALHLSGWAPTAAFGGRRTTSQGTGRLREALVLVQFTVSAAVIAATLLMFAQMRYIATRPLGFEKENRVLVTLHGANAISQLPSIRNELLRNGDVLGVARIAGRIGQGAGANVALIEDEKGETVQQSAQDLMVDADFLDVMGITLLQGRKFSREAQGNVGCGVLVNETLVRLLAWSEPLGKRVNARSLPTGCEHRVIGVVKDFNYASLHSPLGPLFIHVFPQEEFRDVPPAMRATITGQAVVRISGRDVRRTLSSIEDVMKRSDPGSPFEYEFLDQQLGKLYRAETHFMQLIGLFAGVCVFIACLGLYGLVSYTTEQRGREIAIRKTLGATAAQIVGMLAKRILVLVLVASGFAAVLAGFAIDEWLNGFAYRARIDPMVFVYAAFVASAVAFGTVALQAWKTASGDPVDALRQT